MDKYFLPTRRKMIVKDWNIASLLSPAQLSSPHGGSGGPEQGVILSHTHDSSTPNVHRQGVGLCTPPHTRVGVWLRGGPGVDLRKCVPIDLFKVRLQFTSTNPRLKAAQ